VAVTVIRIFTELGWLRGIDIISMEIEKWFFGISRHVMKKLLGGIEYLGDISISVSQCNLEGIFSRFR
jgi:hypothetical protein